MKIDFYKTFKLESSHVCVVCLELLKVLIPRHALMNKRGLFCFIFLAKSWPDQKLLPLIFVFENVSRLDSPGQTWRKKTLPYHNTFIFCLFSPYLQYHKKTCICFYFFLNINDGQGKLNCHLD